MTCKYCGCGLNHELTPSEKKIVSAALATQSIEDIPKKMRLASTTVKKHLNSIYRKRGIRSGIKSIRLLTEELYGRRPDLIPFANGDRAAQVGELSATRFAQLKTCKDLQRLTK